MNKEDLPYPQDMEASTTGSVKADYRLDTQSSEIMNRNFLQIYIII